MPHSKSPLIRIASFGFAALLLASCGSEAEETTPEPVPAAQDDTATEPAAALDLDDTVELDGEELVPELDVDETELLPEAPETPAPATPADAPPESQRNPLSAKWLVTSILVDGEERLVTNNFADTSLFIEGTTYFGYDGCIEYDTDDDSVRYDIEGSDFEITRLSDDHEAVTCATDASAHYWTALRGATTWTIEDGTLSLNGDTTSMVLSPGLG